MYIPHSFPATFHFLSFIKVMLFLFLKYEENIEILILDEKIEMSWNKFTIM